MSARRWAAVLTAVAGLLATAVPALAGGISVDAGLTPPQGRWILRSQLRAMSRETPDGMNDVKMDRLMVPFVVVHGATPALTLGLRQIIEFRSLARGGMESEASGLGDLYAFMKYKVLRINTRNFTLGLSPVLGFGLPTGSDDISAGAFDVNVGLYGSVRSGHWALDVNLNHGVTGVAGLDAGDPDPGNTWELTTAFARQIPVGSSGNVAAAPVLEVTWTRSAPDDLDGAHLPDSGEDILSVAPGFKYTMGDVILESLVRIPIAQDQNGMQTEAGIMYLLGLRRMF